MTFLFIYFIVVVVKEKIDATCYTEISWGILWPKGNLHFLKQSHLTRAHGTLKAITFSTFRLWVRVMLPIKRNDKKIKEEEKEKKEETVTF